MDPARVNFVNKKRTKISRAQGKKADVVVSIASKYKSFAGEEI